MIVELALHQHLATYAKKRVKPELTPLDRVLFNDERVHTRLRDAPPELDFPGEVQFATRQPLRQRLQLMPPGVEVRLV